MLCIKFNIITFVKRITSQDVKQAIKDGCLTVEFGAMVNFIINDDRLFDVL